MIREGDEIGGIPREISSLQTTMNRISALIVCDLCLFEFEQNLSDGMMLDSHSERGKIEKGKQLFWLQVISNRERIGSRK